jgi:zinc protease
MTPPRVMVPAAIALSLALASMWRPASGREQDILAGRSRPLLQGNWPLPRDLKFSANAFQPPDAKPAFVKTPEGVRAFIVAANDDPVVRITAAIPIGRAYEQTGEAGASELASRVLTQSVRDRLGRALVGRVQVDQEVDATRVSLQVLTDDWKPALHALVDALRQTSFEAPATFRTGQGFAIQTRGLGGPAFRPAVELVRMVSSYPLAPADPGLAVNSAALAAFASRGLRPDTVVLSVGGGVARVDAEHELQSATSGWRALGTQRPAPPGSAQSKTPAERMRLIDQAGYTTWLAIGHALPKIAPADEASLAVMTDILNIRLNIAVREIRGLANGISLQVPATTRQEGLLQVRSGARPESIAPIVHYSLEEVSRIRTDAGLPTNDELEDVKGGLVLSKWQGSLDGARDASATYALEMMRYGSIDRLMAWPNAVRAVTAADVKRVAMTYVHPERMVTVIIGQLDAVRTARHPRWPLALEEVTAEMPK